MSTPAPRHFLDYVADEHIVICSRMDMRTILNLRTTSRRAMYAVAAMLRANLERLCQLYVPRAPSFLIALDRLHAFVGGNVAAAFLTRQLPAPSAPLEIFVSSEGWAALVDELVQVQGAGMGHIAQAEDDYVENWLERHAIESATPFWTLRGTPIILYESYTSDPLAPIACRPSSVEIAYVNPIYFGTGYPSLTLERRGLVADTRDSSEAADVVEKWESWGIDVRFAAKEWRRYQRFKCAATLGLCPFQLRSFGDDASMRCRMIPTAATPLKTTVQWRLAARRCGVECGGLDGQGSVARNIERFLDA
ncbi:hypothetical protein K466DRAFT_630369 [Polyporus arcularius HHB13444]|uniref:Uncharacterized protein n=1 Tax=Polyporus arcularius HHB13444 TaxID=1314778 RepID=A0A5C3P2I5_9APHY|nr:hypothetical protein K466DRAFT_630369 [Polyporus arcularius HHB13444]